MGLIRVLLALAVVVHHIGGSLLGFHTLDGSTAVQTFFIISGFYMSLILNEKYIGQSGSYSLFITNRFLRLYPLYFVVLILSLLYALFIYSWLDKPPTYSNPYVPNLTAYGQYYDSMSLFTFVWLVISNLIIFCQDFFLFLKLNLTNGQLSFTTDFSTSEPILAKFMLIAPAWSISLELLFYLLAPFLVRRKPFVIVLIVTVSLALRAYLYYSLGLRHDPWTYRFFPTELAYFLLGSLSYAIYKWVKAKAVPSLYLTLASVFMLVFVGAKGMLPSTMVVQTAYIVSFTVLLPLVFLRTKNWRIDTYIGELSYPIYIGHMLVLGIVDALQLRFLGKKGPVVIIAVIILALLLNEIVSKRVEKIRQRRVYAKVPLNTSLIT